MAYSNERIKANEAKGKKMLDILVIPKDKKVSQANHNKKGSGK